MIVNDCTVHHSTNKIALISSILVVVVAGEVFSVVSDELGCFEWMLL